uniref:Tetratricopeptide repeat protein 21B n=1 Tax=Trichuris muris TaxID=70415 RepID=A0A5S6QNM1_TRIMR
MSDHLLNAELLYHLREKNYASVLQRLRGKENLLDDGFNRLLLGIALLMSSDIDGSITEFEQIARNPKVGLGAMMGLIEAHQLRGDVGDQRISDLKGTLDAMKTTPSEMALYALATVLFFTGHYDEADKELVRLLMNFPRTAEALILKGWLELATTSDAETALRHIEMGASKNNFLNDPNILLGRAKCAELSGRIDDALAELSKIGSTNGTFLPASVERAKLLLSKRNWEAFAAELQSCKEQFIGDYGFLKLWILALIVYYGSYAEASKCMVQLRGVAAQIRVKSACFMTEIISVYIRSSGRDERILEASQQLIESIQNNEQNNGDVKCLLGELYRMKRSYSESLKEYQAAALLQRSSLPSLSGIAHCMLMEQKMNDAEAQLELMTAVDSSWQQSAEGSFLLCLVSLQRAKDLASLGTSLDDLKAKFQNHIENVKSSYPNGIQLLQALNADRFLEMLQLAGDLQKQLPNHICSTALSILTILLEYIPGLLAAFFLKACFYLMQDLPDKATEELRECLAKDTENPSVYLLLAEISLRQRNFDAAKSTLEAAVSYDFNVRHRPSYHLIRALIAVASHETKDANAILTNAIQLYSLKPSKGKTKFSDHMDNVVGNVEQSFLTYESLESTKLKIQLELAKLLQLDGNFEETEKILDALRQEYGEEHEGQIIFIQCDLLLKKKDVNKALRLLSEVSADKWYYVETRKIMADIYLTYKKDKRQYIACFKEMMHSSPTPEILIAAGDAYARILEMEKAIETYETALRKNPKDFALTRKIGQVYVRSHNYLKVSCFSQMPTVTLWMSPLQAVSYFEAALKRSGHDLIRYDLALLLLKLGNYDKCERYMRQYFDAFKEQKDKKSSDLKTAAKFYELYSRLYLLMNQHQLSIETLQKAKNLYHELAKSEGTIRGEDNKEHLLQASRLSQRIGNFYESQHVYSKAAIHYTEGLKYDAKNIQLMLSLAHIHLITDNLEECHQQCIAVTKIDKNNDEATLMLADLMYQKNEMSTALDLFKSLLERNPNQYHALQRVVEFSLRVGTTEDVESLFASALTKNRRATLDCGFNYCKGVYEWRTGNPSGALSFFSKARKDAQWGEQATYNMIEILLNPENKIVGSEAWKTDQLNEADASLANHSAGSVQLKIADMYLKELRFKQKNDFKYKLMENFLLLASKDKTAPEKVLNNLRRMGGDDESQDELNVGVVLGLARAYRLLKQNAKAKVNLKKTMNMPWNFENANWLEQCWLLLADIYIGQSKNESALEVLKTCVKHNASCIKAMDYMGTISQKLQMWKNAISDYEKAWRLSKQRDVDIGYKLAYCYLKAKMYVAAIGTCHAVLQMRPDYPKVRQEILEKARVNLRP